MDLRKSAELFPLDRRFRIASASFLANMAMQQADAGWKVYAVPEIRRALRNDPTQADILAMLVACELSLGMNYEATQHYIQFKTVARKSPLLDMVKDARPLRN